MRQKKRKILNGIICDWNNCGKEFNNALDLNDHIKSHLSTIKNVNSSGKYGCKWIDCDFETECENQFARHAYYHGYYAGLSLQGVYEDEINSMLPNCLATPKNISKIPELKIDFYCEWGDCMSKFLSIVEFQDHIERHVVFDYEIEKTPENEHPKLQCKWTSCKKYFTSKYRLKEHVCKHSKKKKIACQNCGELFRTSTTFADHLKRQADNDLDYQCAQCLKLFPSEKLLREHVVKHINGFKCNLCDMTRSSASALATHIRYVHLKDKPFKCTLCDHSSVREYDLTRHMTYVHNKMKHKCEHPGCSYAVHTMHAFKRHILNHNNNPQIYVCHCCEKAYRNGKSLSVHLMKVHNFQRPSGHKRFAYRVDENGFYRLETLRIESVEVTEMPNDCNTTEGEAVNNANSNVQTVNISSIMNDNPDGTKESIIAEVNISLPSF